MNETVYYPINHAIDLALHRSRHALPVKRDMDGYRFQAVLVPATPAGERFGVPPGRYLLLEFENAPSQLTLASDQEGVSRGSYPTLVLR